MVTVELCSALGVGVLSTVWAAVDIDRFDLAAFAGLDREGFAANSRFVALFTRVFCCFAVLLVVG